MKKRECKCIRASTMVENLIEKELVDEKRRQDVHDIIMEEL